MTFRNFTHYFCFVSYQAETLCKRKVFGLQTGMVENVQR